MGISRSPLPPPHPLIPNQNLNQPFRLSFTLTLQHILHPPPLPPPLPPSSSPHSHQTLQRHLGRILLGVIDVLAVVPETGADDLVGDGDGGGPGGATAAAVGDDAEDGVGEGEGAAVVCCGDVSIVLFGMFGGDREMVDGRGGSLRVLEQYFGIWLFTVLSSALIKGVMFVGLRTILNSVCVTRRRERKKGAEVRAGKNAY